MNGYKQLKRQALLFAAGIYYKRSPYKAQYPQKEYTALKQDKGAYGEYLLCYLLRKEKGLWLFNLYIPGREEQTEIDALCICGRGILLFESKNFKGWIHGRPSQRDWVQSLRTEKGIRKMRFFNPLMQNSAHKRALSALLPKDTPLYPMVVFGMDAELHTTDTGALQGALISFHDLKRTVRSLGKGRLSKEQIAALYQQLLPYTHVSTDTKRSHLRHAYEKRR